MEHSDYAKPARGAFRFAESNGFAKLATLGAERAPRAYEFAIGIFNFARPAQSRKPCNYVG
jgi:hypothetical protein